MTPQTYRRIGRTGGVLLGMKRPMVGIRVRQMRTMPRRLPVIVMVVVLTACAPTARQETAGTAAPVAPLPDLPTPVGGEGMVDDAGTIVRSVQPQWKPGSDEITMSDEWGEHPVVLEPPVPASVLAGPIEVDGADWVPGLRHPGCHALAQ